MILPKNFNPLCRMLLVLLVSCAARAEADPDADFSINVFYPADAGIDSMIQSSVNSVSSPDFHVRYKPIASSTWESADSLTDHLVSTQQFDPADGFYLACKSTDLEYIGDRFRKTFPKVPFVDSFAPALMAANIVSYRHLAITGTANGEARVTGLIQELGIENHFRFGGSSGIVRDYFMVKMMPYTLTTPKKAVVDDIVLLGNSATGADNTDEVVVSVEAIILAGCEGFLEIGVASDAQATLKGQGIPLQVINPTKASMGLLYSMIRNKVWISVPTPYTP